MEIKIKSINDFYGLSNPILKKNEVTCPENVTLKKSVSIKRTTQDVILVKYDHTKESEQITKYSDENIIKDYIEKWDYPPIEKVKEYFNERDACKNVKGKYFKLVTNNGVYSGKFEDVEFKIKKTTNPEKVNLAVKIIFCGEINLISVPVDDAEEILNNIESIFLEERVTYRVIRPVKNKRYPDFVKCVSEIEFMEKVGSYAKVHNNTNNYKELYEKQKKTNSELREILKQKDVMIRKKDELIEDLSNPILSEIENELYNKGKISFEEFYRYDNRYDAFRLGSHKPLSATTHTLFKVIELEKAGYDFNYINNTIRISESTIRTFLKNYHKGLMDRAIWYIFEREFHYDFTSLKYDSAKDYYKNPNFEEEYEEMLDSLRKSYDKRWG